MLCKQSNHDWLGRFAIHLMRMHDDVSLPEAVRRAVVAHGHAASLPPEEAAAIESRLRQRQFEERQLHVVHGQASQKRAGPWRRV